MLLLPLFKESNTQVRSDLGTISLVVEELRRSGDIMGNNLNTKCQVSLIQTVYNIAAKRINGNKKMITLNFKPHEARVFAEATKAVGDRLYHSDIMTYTELLRVGQSLMQQVLR